MERITEMNELEIQYENITIEIKKIEQEMNELESHCDDMEIEN